MRGTTGIMVDFGTNFTPKSKRKCGTTITNFGASASAHKAASPFHAPNRRQSFGLRTCILYVLFFIVVQRHFLRLFCAFKCSSKRQLIWLARFYEAIYLNGNPLEHFKFETM